MRRFVDREGRSWDIVVGRESFGALYALFVPAAGNPAGMRQTLLQAESRGGALSELDGLQDEDIEALLQRSDPKET